MSSKFRDKILKWALRFPACSYEQVQFIARVIVANPRHSEKLLAPFSSEFRAAVNKRIRAKLSKGSTKPELRTSWPKRGLEFHRHRPLQGGAFEMNRRRH
jgi:hypothetical protein